MNKAKFNRDLFKAIFVFALLILSACGTNNAEPPTATLTPTLPVPTITKTPNPTSTVTPSPTATPVFEEFGLSTDLVKALKAHTGLESSLNKEAGGQYSVTATVLSSGGQPTTQSMPVVPSTLSEDLESKNAFGNTPTLQTVNGEKLYLIQEQKGWFAVEISADINKPVFIPFDQREVTTRVIVAEFNLPFSQKAIDRWITWNTSPALGFQYLLVNVNTGEGTKFGYLVNDSALSPDVTERPIQLIDAWFTTTLPDGTKYQFFPTKWLDPVNPRKPKADEWKIIFVASGQEIMGDKNNREKYDDLLALANTPGTGITVSPIIAADDNFFNNTNGLITLFVAQPSLRKLLSAKDNNLAYLDNPNNDGYKFGFWIDEAFKGLSPDKPGFGIYFHNDNPDYKDNFFHQDIQRIIFPSMIIHR